MAKKKQTIEQIETSLARWRTRVKRAMTMIDKLERARKRLTKAEAIVEPVLRKIAGQPKTPEGAVLVTVPPALTTQPGKVLHGGRAEQGVIMEQPSDDIPAFLRRNTAPSPVADEIRQQQADTKKAKARGRIERMKAKQRGDLKRMPLSGRDALAAIRNG